MCVRQGPLPKCPSGLWGTLTPKVPQIHLDATRWFWLTEEDFEIGRFGAPGMTRTCDTRSRKPFCLPEPGHPVTGV